MSRFPKPCLVCNVLTTGASYCTQHLIIVTEREKQRQAMRKRSKAYLYNDSNYRRVRAYLKATATHCHLCKQPFTNRNDITADHLIPGDINSPLDAAHSLCNSRRGNKPIQ